MWREIRMISHSSPWLIQEDFAAVEAIMRTGMISYGHEVKLFEQDLAAYLHAADVVTCGTGTAAIIVSLLALGIGSGDEVILPTYVCHSVVDAISAVGATPVLCDVGPLWTMTAETVKPHITVRTKAIIIVHIFGIVADVHTIKGWGIPVIEDCCQAFGLRYEQKKFSLQGNLAVFSFNATKCLTAGEGGAIVTDNLKLMEHMRAIINKKTVPSVLTDMQAALGRQQLKRYWTALKRREEIAKMYFDHIPKQFTDKINHVRDRSLFFRFLLHMPDRYPYDEICHTFSLSGIAVRRGVDQLLHRSWGIPDDGFINACQCFDHTVSIPIYPSLQDHEVHQIIEEVKKFE